MQFEKHVVVGIAVEEVWIYEWMATERYMTVKNGSLSCSAYGSMPPPQHILTDIVSCFIHQRGLP